VIKLMNSESGELRRAEEVNQVATKNQEPVLCSKCYATYESDDQYLQHYDEVHKKEIS
jgi:hypothetical protein